MSHDDSRSVEGSSSCISQRFSSSDITFHYLDRDNLLDEEQSIIRYDREIPLHNVLRHRHRDHLQPYCRV